MASMMNLKALKVTLTSVALFTMVGCQNPKGESEGSSSRLNSGEEALLGLKPGDEAPGDQFVLVGPQAIYENSSGLYAILAPAGTDLGQVTVQWNSGNGGLESTQSFPSSGVYNISARVISGGGSPLELKRQVLVLPLLDSGDCKVEELSIAGPNQIEQNSTGEFSVSIPTCLSSLVTATQYSVVNSSNSSTSLASSSFTPTQTGDYQIQAQLFGSNPNVPFLTLIKDISVTERAIVIQQLCPEPGLVRTRTLSLGSESVNCGIDGTKDISREAFLTEECRYENPELLTWVEISREVRTASESPCTGQSCSLPNSTERLNDGQSKDYFSTSLPSGSCSEVRESRTCQNGVLSGSFTNLTCASGCGSFGAHGAVVNNVLVGEVQQPVSCPIASDTGVFNLFEERASQTCVDGSVITGTKTQGALISEGKCPVYSWQGTENYTTCDADCGGSQQRIFECRNESGAAFTDGRCGTQAPIESRICDGNPEAVKSSVETVRTEEAPASATCPKGQVGVVVKERTVTKTEKYACINHKVDLESTTEVASPWVTETYCRTNTAYRCSHDSLDNTQAQGRYLWMKKCESQVPVIAEFLKSFEDVVVNLKNGKTADLESSGRKIYPTFAERFASGSTKFWKAPTVASASCAVPPTLFVAATCVSSCATPEMMILSEVKDQKKLKYHSFIEALTSNLKSVASYKGKKTAVDQWVTELEDSEHQILEFVMRSGGSLKITLNHPLLGSDGVMRLAEEFKVGDQLIQANGQFDPIVEINQQTHFGKVYNLFLKSSDPLRNIVITQGYLNGSAYFQNEGAKDMNRKLLRNRLKAGAIR